MKSTKARPFAAAQSLPLPRASVRADPLERIWAESPVMTAFRGTDWMPLFVVPKTPAALPRVSR